ncbi:MAG: GNAT family N-acetyltransferase [bacterium]|nr:GNAT family N-acetyltransferase [bacterium]
MEIKHKNINAQGIKFFIEDSGREVARAYLYVLLNEHDRPFGLLEDVFVGEAYRSKGLGGELLKEIIKTAKEKNCYKLIGTSRFARPKVHEWYLRLGFKDWGKEFRMDF